VHLRGVIGGLRSRWLGEPKFAGEADGEEGKEGKENDND